MKKLGGTVVTEKLNWTHVLIFPQLSTVLMEPPTGHSYYIIPSLSFTTLILVVLVNVVVFQCRCHIHLLNKNNLSCQNQSWIRNGGRIFCGISCLRVTLVRVVLIVLLARSGLVLMALFFKVVVIVEKIATFEQPFLSC